MSPAAKPPSKVNTNTVIGGLSLSAIIALLAGTHRYLVPIETLPISVDKLTQEVSAANEEISSIKHTQIIQTEAIKTLAEVASDTKSMRREVDKHGHELENVKRRLDTLEK